MDIETLTNLLLKRASKLKGVEAVSKPFHFSSLSAGLVWIDGKKFRIEVTELPDLD